MLSKPLDEFAGHEKPIGDFEDRIGKLEFEMKRLRETIEKDGREMAAVKSAAFSGDGYR